MKVNLLLTLGLMLFCAESFAQDIIHTLDERPIEAKVLEITDDYVRYKTFDNLEGPDYRMSVNRVVRIVFENGTEKAFSSPAPLTSSGYYGPVRYRYGRFFDYRGRLFENSDDFMGVALFGSDYRKARGQFFWGFGLTSIGAALVVASLVGSSMVNDFNRDNHSMRVSNDTEKLFGVMGVACLGAGIPLWISGNRKLNKIADEYNKNYGRGNVGYNPSLELKSGANGVGLALNF